MQNDAFLLINSISYISFGFGRSVARQKAYDVALIFSQDQDLTEAVEEIKDIAEAQKSMDKGHISISP
jgi:hypothetical protein